MKNFKIPEIVGFIIARCVFPCFCYPGDLQTLKQASSPSNASYEMCAHRAQKFYTPGIFLRLFLSASGDKIEKNEMCGACRAYGGEERRIQGFVEET